MNEHPCWTRREFLSTIGATAAAAAAARLRVARHSKGPEPVAARHALALVGCSGEKGSLPGRIQMYDVHGSNWNAVDHPTTTESPRALTLHPVLPVLYVAHHTSPRRHLRRGSVSAFRIDPRLRTITPLSHEPLALSAIAPEYLSVALDGRSLLVSASGGGAYNIFSLAEDGAVLSSPYPLKQTGCGPYPSQKTSRPHASVMHPTCPFAYSSDLGADRINQISLEYPLPHVANSISLHPGSGPSYIALHSSGSMLIVSSTIRPALSVLPVHPITGELRPPMHHHPLPAEIPGPISLNLAGDRIYLASKTLLNDTRLCVFELDPGSGAIRVVQRVAIPSIRHPEQLLLDGDQLLVIGSGGIASLPVDRGRSLLGEPLTILQETDSVSLAFYAL